MLKHLFPENSPIDDALRRIVLYLGIAAYAALAILAITYYLERTVMLDIALRLFYILKDDAYAIQVNRFGSVITQSIPLLSSRMGMGLENILKVYSLGYVAFHFAIFLLCVAWKKSWKFGALILLYSVFVTTHTFYWIQSELLEGMALSVLFFCMICTNRNRSRTNLWQYPLLAFLLATLAFYHPLMIFPFLYLAFFFYQDSKVSIRVIIVTSITFVIFYLVKLFFFRNYYDSQAMGNLGNFSSLFPDYINLQANRNFVQYVVEDYYLLPLGLTCAVIFYALKKRWIKLAYLLVSFFGYLLIINVTYPDGGEQFYFESFYMPLGIIVAAPLVFDITTLLKPKIVLVVLLLILTVRIFHIGASHQTYTERVEYLRFIMSQTADLENKKLIIKEDEMARSKLLMTWGCAFECWLLSTIETGESRSLLIAPNPKDFRHATQYNRKFISLWHEFDYDELTGEYFRFTDTSYYRIAPDDWRVTE